MATAIEQEVLTDVHFNLFPNSASIFSTMEWISTGQAWNTTILDKWGHQVQSWNGPNGSSKLMSQKVNLPSVPSGHYYINIRQGNQSVTRGIMIN